ncbi:MAG TPA: hypothetical protein VFB74_12760, partial [Kribbellaceae bacterium]|nr:hypothetical protein [Kribbellaceae bacterium]
MRTVKTLDLNPGDYVWRDQSTSPFYVIDVRPVRHPAGEAAGLFTVEGYLYLTSLGHWSALQTFTLASSDAVRVDDPAMAGEVYGHPRVSGIHTPNTPTEGT